MNKHIAIIPMCMHVHTHSSAYTSRIYFPALQKQRRRLSVNNSAYSSAWYKSDTHAFFNKFQWFLANDDSAMMVHHPPQSGLYVHEHSVPYKGENSAKSGAVGLTSRWQARRSRQWYTKQVSIIMLEL